MKLLLVVLILSTPTGFFSCGTAPTQPVASAPTPNAGWRVYTSPDKSFSVELPCEPKQTNVSEESTPVFQYSCHSEESNDLQVFMITVLKADFEVGKTRDEAISRMKRSLSEFVIEGVHTTIPFHLKLLNHEKFIEGEFNTKFLELHDVMNSVE